jgi:predicted phage terminase large subunit-like protein
LRPDEWTNPPPQEKLVERARKDLLQRISATVGGEALYQGRATMRSGGIAKEEWFSARWTVMPTGPGEWVQSWDPKASSSKRPWASYTVGQVWFRPHGKSTCYLIDERRGKVGIDGALVMIRELSKLYPQATKKIIERKGYGGAMLDLLKTELTGLDDNVPKGDKAMRLEAVVPLLSAGNIIIPDQSVRPWVSDWVREVTRFSGKPTDVADRVDAMSQALDRWKSVALPFTYQVGGGRQSNGFR